MTQDRMQFVLPKHALVRAASSFRARIRIPGTQFSFKRAEYKDPLTYL